MPNVLSVDVGIKNLSYCLLKVCESSTHPNQREIEILKWNTLNLNDADEVKPSIQPLDVRCTTKFGCKLKPCYFYVDGVTDADMYTCKRHYKTIESRRVFETKPAYISKVLKTFTLEKMREFCTEHGILPSCNIKSKAEFKTIIIDIFKTKYVYPLDQRDLYASIIRPPSQDNPVVSSTSTSTTAPPHKSALVTNSSTVSLVFVGYNLMKKFDALFYGTEHAGSPGCMFPRVDAVVIENQISPIANRMKTVQGMITQYFLMRGVDKRLIIYFSSVQKLKVAPYHFVFYNSGNNNDDDIDINPVYSEEDGEKDEDSDEDADEDVDEDSEEDSEEDSDEDSEENVDEDVDDNGEKSGDLDIDDSTDGEDEVHVGVEELDDRESTFVLSEVEDCSILGESPAPEDESDRIKTVVLNDDTEHSENPFLEISTTNRPNSSFDIKSIDILTLDDTANDESDLKKLSLNKLRTLAVTKGLIQDASRLKKHELLKLLEKE